MRANAIRCLHTGHIGRSLVEAVIPQIPAADHTPSAAGVFNIRARRTFRGAPKGTSPVGPGWASRFARKRGLRGPAPSPQKAGLCSCETILAIACLSALALASPVEAKGCIKGAIVGGVAGHYAGHHGVLGAAAGCLYGRHQAKEQERQQRQGQVNGQGKL